MHRSFGSSVRHLLAVSLLAAAVFRLPAGLFGQSHQIGQAREGLLEAGSPLFTVLNQENLGLDTPPTDLHIMPDGRVLVVAGTQLAFGDGVRWEVFNQVAGEVAARALTVAVDADGRIYEAIQGGFAQVVFGENGRWRLKKVADWPAGVTADRSVPRHIIVSGAQWFWHNNSGLILSWRPGQTAQSVGLSDTVSHIFQFHGQFYVCDWHEGAVTLLPAPGEAASTEHKKVLTEAFLTCAQPYREDRMVVGTTVFGLQLFDGHSLQPFPAKGILSEKLRINSLCLLEGGFYSAAVENYGVVFFDEQGRTIQSLDRTLDHRLSRVLQLIPGHNGIVWGLLAEGIFRVEFPSRISHFEPIVNSGLATVHPNRSEGELWLIADNQLLHATYAKDGRLSGFVSDTPANQSIFALSCKPGRPVAGSEQGGYYRSKSGWVNFAPASRNLRILQNDPIDGQWLYCAENEIGWLRASDNGMEVQRHPIASLGKVYNSVTDGHGDVWLECGSGLLGRIHPGHPTEGFPSVEFFDGTRGVPQGWAQVFVLDGEVRFNVADRILRLDEVGNHLVADEEFGRAFAGLGTIVGRPGRDSLGRLWISTEQGVHIFTGPLNHLQRVNEPMPAGFQPYYFTFESGGVVWMHSNRRLARYDPYVPASDHQPLRALITHVNLPSNGRVLYPVGDCLPVLNFADNSLIPHFLAINDQLNASVTFDVKLAGSGQDWVASGSTGSAVFNRLAGGDYVLQVRPSSLGIPGEISSLAFTISPPWYRTVPAYVIGTILSLGLIFVIGWLFTYLQRREKLRLENLVAQRTSELNQSNVRLASQVDEIRTLSQAIQQSPVGVLIIKAAGTIVFANARVCELSGYTLAELLGQPIRLLRDPAPADEKLENEFNEARRRGESWQGELANRSKTGRIFHVRVTASPLRGNSGDIPHYLLLEEDITETLAEQEHHRRLEAQLFLAQKRESLGTLAGGIAHDFNNILTGILGYNELIQLSLGEHSPVSQELSAIRSAGQRAKELIGQILTLSSKGNAQLTPLDISRPVAEALKLIRASTPSTIEIIQSLQPGTVRADPTQIHQVVLNLCTNAAHAMHGRPGRVEVRLEPISLTAPQAAEIAGLQAGAHMRLTISDTGTGMDQTTLNRIFDPFFTTKQPGEGTGLGLSIVQGIVAGHKGALVVRSEPGAGTTFELFFPVTREARSATTPPMPAPEGGEQEIIVVDDEPMVTSFVSARLKRLGYRPTVLNDPREALEIVTQNPHRFAAIISDLTMPHMTGVELIRQLHERGIDLPTLIITGYNLNAARADLATLPKCLVLNKPFAGEELAQALHRAISGARSNGKPVSPIA